MLVLRLVAAADTEKLIYYKVCASIFAGYF